MSMRLRGLAAVVGLLLCAEARPEGSGVGTIAGVALDTASGRPLVGALVQLTGPTLDTPRTVLSEDGGKFTLEDLPAGSYALSVKLDGFQPFRRAEVAVKEGETARVGAWLAPEGTEGDEVVVTGSRIRRKDVTSAAPVTIIDHEQIVQSGEVGLGEFLQNLPFQGNALNARRNYGNDGEVRMDLRSLEPKRTLVLVNGRRWIAGGSGAGGEVDLDTIPLAAVDHIEILKDGASAIYGSDAIAGVVNVVLKQKFEGTQLAAQGGVSSRGDAESYDLSGSTGVTGERGSVFFSVGYQEQKPLMGDARRFSRDPLTYHFTDGSTTKSLSPTTGNGSIAIQGVETVCADPGAIANPVLRQACQDWAGSATAPADRQNDFTWDPRTRSYKLRDGSDGYNYQPASYLLTPARRLQLFTTGNYGVGKEARLFYEASFVNRRSKTNAPPMPLYDFSVSKDSEYNPFGTDLSVTRRMMELGGRRYAQEQNTYRLVLGVGGEVGGWAGPLQGWKWEVSLNYGRNVWQDTSDGAVRASHLTDATGPSQDVDGVPTCLAASGQGCTPVDVLHGVGTLTPEQRRYLTFSGTSHGQSEMYVLSAGANGDLFRLWADRKAALAAGVDLRREWGGYWPDPITAAGDSTDNAMLPLSGGFTARELYAELSVPIVSQRPLVEELELTAALRNVRYTSFGGDTSYSLGGRWRPVRDVTLRGTWSTAFRAPSIEELYLSASDAFYGNADPCVDPSNPVIRQQCMDQIGHALGTNPTDMKTREGGSTALRPETAKIFTAGVVIEPRWLKRLSLTVDYWDIHIEHTIDKLNTNNILAGCYTGDPATVNQGDCNRVHRNQDSGQIDYVDDTLTNIGGTRTSGVDLAARWTLPAHAVGTFTFGLDGTYLIRFDRTTADGTIRAAGTYDLLFGLPRWRWNGRIGWQRGPVGLTSEARYVGSFRECGNSEGESGGGSCDAFPQYSRHVRPYLIYDLAASYELESRAGKTSVLIGVRNVFDTAPPKVFNGADNNTDPAYDYTGRSFWARVAQTF